MIPRRLAWPKYACVTMLFVGGFVRVGMAQPSQGMSMMRDTKHDLSATSAAELRATSEKQLCVFCHTPHVPTGFVTEQLWNREPSTATYELYSSDYLTNINYEAPEQPGERSKLCLSCHDGTIAIGAVYNNGGGPMTVEMRDNVVTMPTGSKGYVGTSLLNDHPVGYTYDHTRDPELVGRTWPWSTPVRLDPDDNTGKVECQTCHDPHNNENGYFLRISNENAGLCLFCHNKTGWSDAIHRTSPQSIVISDTSNTTMGEWACRSCHESHNGEGIPYLLTKSEENTCFESGCHGANGTGAATVDIQSEYDKAYAHPTVMLSARHKNPDAPADLAEPNRHAECQDCHNSHQAKKGLHTTGSNLLSNVLTGVSGVIPESSPIWSQPISYTDAKPAIEENQVCFKCHSSYAFGTVPNGVTTISGPSGTFLTDQAMEFNPANRSAHPVRVPSNGQTGSTAPQALGPDALSAAWNNPGQQTMYCSDCHGSDQPASSSDPQGPHGSDYPFMLTGPGKYWPATIDGRLWSLADIQNDLDNWQNDLFCANCHPMKVGGVLMNNVHDLNPHRGATCVTCHVAVPHGSARSRLIGYASDPPPYNYEGRGALGKLVIVGFHKATGPNNYQKEDCSMSGICHGTQINVYEP